MSCCRPAGSLRRRILLRLALVVVGMVQLASPCRRSLGDSIGMAMSEHGAHEGAAWNLAIGVAFAGRRAGPRAAPPGSSRCWARSSSVLAAL